jgi:acyl carrier protein
MRLSINGMRFWPSKRIVASALFVDRIVVGYFPDKHRRKAGAMIVVTEALNEEELELTRLIVDTLNLDLDLKDIEPETALYGKGLGLDSIDILEVALAVSQRYGVTLHADDENNTEIFMSVRALSDYIRRNKPE